MNRRNFVGILATTPIGLWAASHFPSLKATPLNKRSPWDTTFVKPLGNYSARVCDDVVIAGRNTATITLPSAIDSQRVITVSAPHADCIVIGDGLKAMVRAREARQFISNGTCWLGGN